MNSNENMIDNARSSYESIRALLGATDPLVWDLLENLSSERTVLSEAISEAFDCVARHHNDVVSIGGEFPEHAEYRRCIQELMDWDDEHLLTLKDLQAATEGFESVEDAEERIQETPLSVEVRSGWGSATELQPEEYRIVLCCGGPHVEIRGDLNQYQEPCTAVMLMQDWGTPLTEFHEADEDVLVQFAQKFYYGEG